jgi:hypothetical protein
MFVLFSFYAQAQQKMPVEPTSATDSDVKIHKKISLFRHSKTSRKVKGQAHSTERPGRSLPRKQSGFQFLGKEANVFKRHYAKPEVNLRKKTRVIRKASLTKVSRF